MLRASIKAGTPLGKQVDAILTRGELVSDDIVIGIIAERVDQPDCAKGAVFDGFPRTVAQAEALDAMLAKRGKRIDLVIELKVNEPALLVQRAEQRYNEALAKGGTPRPDDNAGDGQRPPGGLSPRTPQPLLDFYREQGKVVTMDGMVPIGDVTDAIARALDRKAGLLGKLFGH